MNFNLSDCDRGIADCIGELANYFDVHICKKGIRLTVFPSEIFRVSKKGDCAQIFYSERCQIFKGIAELMSHCGDFDREYTASFDTLALMEDFARNAVMQVSKQFAADLAESGRAVFLQIEMVDTFVLVAVERTVPLGPLRDRDIGREQFRAVSKVA